MKIISILGFQGGAGRTTIAANLAFALSLKKKVLLIDIDPNMGLTQYLLGKKYESVFLKENKLKPGSIKITGAEDESKTNNSSYSFTKDWSEKIDIKNTIIGLLESKSVLNEGFPIKIENSNLFFIPSHPTLLLLHPDKDPFTLKKLFSQISDGESFDYIILDTPATPSIFVNSAIYASKYYLSIFSPGGEIFSSFSILKDYYIPRVIDNSGEKINLGVVINKIKTDTQYKALSTRINELSPECNIHRTFSSCKEIADFSSKIKIHSKFVYLGVPGDRRKSAKAYKFQSELLSLSEKFL